MIRTVLRALAAFVRREAVFCAAALCALVSACVVPPSAAYTRYIDWNTLCILFALMGVVGALRSCGVFSTLGGILCRRFRSVRALCAVLVALCFFSSMFITNDVALLTFVPFTLSLLAPVANGSIVMRVVILQTIAANTGSMLTPLGNPQNLFLFQQTGLPLGRFLAVMLPYTALSALLLLGAIVQLHTAGTITGDTAAPQAALPQRVPPVRHVHRHERATAAAAPRLPIAARITVYTALFVLCLLAVFRVLPKPAAAAAVFLGLFVTDRRLLAGIDYMLLATFVAFFIFTGNIAHIPPLQAFLERAVSGHEWSAAVAVSQFISNVPATLLLYPFAAESRALLIGVNVGGLGTLVASLASLISYKLYAAHRERALTQATQPPETALPGTGRYLATFTLYNVLALGAMVALYAVLGVCSR